MMTDSGKEDETGGDKSGVCVLSGMEWSAYFISYRNVMGVWEWSNQPRVNLMD